MKKKIGLLSFLFLFSSATHAWYFDSPESFYWGPFVDCVGYCNEAMDALRDLDFETYQEYRGKWLDQCQRPKGLRSASWSKPYCDTDLIPYSVD